jgi:hypothetical protein
VLYNNGSVLQAGRYRCLCAPCDSCSCPLLPFAARAGAWRDSVGAIGGLTGPAGGDV